MDKKLPPRPNLDHLRRQAKALLVQLQNKDPDAVKTMLQHLPAAAGMRPQQVTSANFRLADAQSAIARKSGFASWPHLARHVEQLRALEGTWSFARLEMNGQNIPASALQSSRLLIDGDRFRTESPEANYEGIFNINVEAIPHEIDIEFIAGPEAGNSNYGIYRVEGDTLEICLDTNGKPRPEEFRAPPGTGHVLEILTRMSHARPEEVTGGTAPAQQTVPTVDPREFAFVESATLAKLQGRWKAVKVVRDGQELPAMMLRSGVRVAEKNEITISFGGQTMVHALVRIDESADPFHVDYCNLDGATRGVIQLGLMKWIGEEACFCMAAPGAPRPTDFTSTPGSGRTLSQWRR